MPTYRSFAAFNPANVACGYVTALNIHDARKVFAKSGMGRLEVREMEA